MIVTVLVAIILAMFLVGMSGIFHMRNQERLIASLQQAVRHQQTMIGIQRKANQKEKPHVLAES